jgi:putative heme-binding domain-containing protein
VGSEFCIRDRICNILAYLRTLAAQAPTEVLAGNAENGEKVFRAQCASCHRANGRGGRLGPDLSRVGISRSRAVVIRRIRGAVEESVPGFEPVTVTTKNGQAVQGVKKNEDLFSVQVMDSRERIQGYLKSDVRQVADGTKSAMPVFGPDRLNESDLADLLSYLATLKGFDPSVGQ